LAGLTDEKLTDDLLKNIQVLQQSLDHYANLVGAMQTWDNERQDLRLHRGSNPLRSREIRVKEAIREAIDVLDESRKAFKSKRLEALRKQLTAVLLNTE
jgi:hypothetical protein